MGTRLLMVLVEVHWLSCASKGHVCLTDYAQHSG